MKRIVVVIYCLPRLILDANMWKSARPRAEEKNWDSVTLDRASYTTKSREFHALLLVPKHSISNVSTGFLYWGRCTFPQGKSEKWHTFYTWIRGKGSVVGGMRRLYLRNPLLIRRHGSFYVTGFQLWNHHGLIAPLSCRIHHLLYGLDFYNLTSSRTTRRVCAVGNYRQFGSLWFRGNLESCRTNFVLLRIGALRTVRLSVEV